MGEEDKVWRVGLWKARVGGGEAGLARAADLGVGGGALRAACGALLGPSRKNPGLQICPSLLGGPQQLFLACAVEI